MKKMHKILLGLMLTGAAINIAEGGFYSSSRYPNQTQGTMKGQLQVAEHALEEVLSKIEDLADLLGKDTADEKEEIQQAAQKLKTMIEATQELSTGLPKQMSTMSNSLDQQKQGKSGGGLATGAFSLLGSFIPGGSLVSGAIGTATKAVTGSFSSDPKSEKNIQQTEKKIKKIDRNIDELIENMTTFTAIVDTLLEMAKNHTFQKEANKQKANQLTKEIEHLMDSVINRNFKLANNKIDAHKKNMDKIVEKIASSSSSKVSNLNLQEIKKAAKSTLPKAGLGDISSKAMNLIN